MSAAFNVAIVGVTSVVGETLVSLLAEREFPVDTLYVLELGDMEAGRVEYRDSYLPVRKLDDFDFSQVALAFFCAGEAVAADYVPRAAAAGCIVIDDSAQFRAEADIPLVVPEVNPEAIGGYRARGIIANPNSCVTALLVALQGIHAAVGIERINVVTFQAVSGMGKPAIDELAAQTMAIFNMKPVSAKVYPKQIAFNVLPSIGEMQDNAHSREELKMLWETRKILGDDTLGVNASCVRVPVFYGHSQAVHIETRDKVTTEAARRILRKSPGVKLVEGGGKGADYPTPVTDAAGEDAVFVGRLREDLSHPRGLDLWIVADNVRKGAALNCIQIAEILVKDYLS